MRNGLFIFCLNLFLGFYLNAQTNTFPPSGKVGIGTTTPTELLDVQGTVKAKKGFFNNTVPNGTVFANSQDWLSQCTLLGIGKDKVDTELLFFFDFPQSNYNSKPRVWFGIEDRDDKARLKMWADQGGATLFQLYGKEQNKIFSIYDPGDAYTFIDFDKPESYMVIGGRNVWPVTHKLTVKDGSSLFEGDVFSTGNVGIGTTTPDSKLTVAGNIHAQEVKVTVEAGADFVFSEDYKLPTLEKIEQFIKANNHLPEIASEKEMQANGIHLAEMNIKLLQKIEELTLYTIEQQKQIEELQKLIKNK